jgi:hypothetical protein
MNHKSIDIIYYLYFLLFYRFHCHLILPLIIFIIHLFASLIYFVNPILFFKPILLIYLSLLLLLDSFQYYYIIKLLELYLTKYKSIIYHHDYDDFNINHHHNTYI